MYTIHQVLTQFPAIFSKLFLYSLQQRMADELQKLSHSFLAINNCNKAMQNMTQQKAYGPVTQRGFGKGYLETFSSPGQSAKMDEEQQELQFALASHCIRP